MKRGLLLRQQVPPDKERITFNTIYEVDDMWIWLFHELHIKLALEHSEVWIWGGGPRTTEYKSDFVEKWHPDFPQGDLGFDFLFSRGGFQPYINVMMDHPNAFRMYYGAIYKPRLNPRAIGDNVPYNLVLADSEKQFNELSQSGYNVHKLIKPACEIIFRPVFVDKKYDIVFVANAPQKSHKGHLWFYNFMDGSGLKILQIGKLDKQVISWTKNFDLDIDLIDWVPRKDVPNLACQAKVAINCATGDSSPRVIPEFLNMGIPTIVVDHEKQFFYWDFLYKDGILEKVNAKEISHDFVKDFIKRSESQTVVNKYYKDNMSLKVSSDRIIDDIKKFS